MESVLTSVAVAEQRIAGELRERALANVSSTGLDHDELGKVLGLLPSGVDSLLRDERWPLDVAVRVADALGMTVNIEAT